MLPVDLESFIKTVGYIGVFVMIFAESGLMVGFFLPGDSLLFTAGFLASQGRLDIAVLAIGCFLAAVAGDAVGYTFGHRVGRRLFKHEESRFFKRSYLEEAEAFFDKHGGKAIFLARFLPIVRTFTPIVAGVSAMSYRRFALFNIAGAFAWAVGVSFAGYELGNNIPGIDRYLLPILAVVIVLSSLPSVFHLWRRRARTRVSVLPPEDAA